MEKIRFGCKQDIEMGANLLAENKTQEKLTVLGTGDFGRALTKRLSTAGYHVVMGSRNPEKCRGLLHLLPFNIVSLNDALEHSDIIFLAIPLHGYDSLSTSLGSQLNGKIVVDVSNRTQTSFNELSNAEYLSSLLPKAHVVKGFNVISAWALEQDIYGGSRIVYICGDNAEAKEKVMQISRTMHLTPFDQGSLQLAQAIENKPLELFPSWRSALMMFGILYLVMWLYYVLKRVILKMSFTNFPLRDISLLNAFTVIGLLDMVYLPGCIAAIFQLVYGTKYRRFPKWLDIWMKSRKQLGLLALLLAAMHGCMSTLYWGPKYSPLVYQDKSIHVNNVTISLYGRMTAQGEAFLTLGVLGLSALSILGITSLPTVLNRMSWREWNFVQSGLGYFSLIFSLLHFIIYYYTAFQTWGTEVLYYPTVWVVGIGCFVVILKIVLLIPYLDNRVKKIRSGWEKATYVT
ncbi:metalloreductase STEAP4-like [Xenia sp. Carnegie-2017]|uniref:metalloreductase STEAP4-like n=1 Tax=Xenia sp. Carnegie-2017 TaxID=2897299 RepID=UPI001F049A12|nr:metalloreductase STEAP4-like [Xenia sp. Carnegie-2017]